MTLIEGVGDEVIQFVGALLMFSVAALAWWSTNARPGRYRTVVVMRSRTHHPVTVSIRARPNLMITNHQASSSSSPESALTVNASEPVEESRDAARVIPLQEMDSIIDADMAMMNNNRLHFYRRIESPGNSQEIRVTSSDSTSDESEMQDEVEASSAQIREMDSIVSAMEADVTAGCDFFARPNENSTSPDTAKSVKSNDTDENVASSSPDVSKTKSDENAQNIENGESGSTSRNHASGDENRRKILIKLKYLNDSLKEVEGSLDELLKDFKWRHFSSELSSECRVRLIFNGRVLGDEAATLRACGLHDRAVVHCLVHPKRTNPQQRPEEGPANPELVTEGQAERATWDLENILMTLVSIALTVVWFFRCEYSNMFTASASVALFGLTVFYSLAIFGLYVSDTFHFDRRAAPPAPAPVPDN